MKLIHMLFTCIMSRHVWAWFATHHIIQNTSSPVQSWAEIRDFMVLDPMVQLTESSLLQNKLVDFIDKQHKREKETE